MTRSTLIGSDGLTDYWRERLRPYQKAAIEGMREAVRRGARNVLICSPTGSGKTEIAACLTDLALTKGQRTNFVVDRKSLIDQTSAKFDEHSIGHGIIQADHPRFRPSLAVQVCSIQTIVRRRWPDSRLDIVDEAHTVTAAVRKRIEPRERITLGLTATPFSKGLGQIYDAIVNVTTTNELIEQGFLAPYRIFSCVEPDMQGVRVVAGEFDRGETEKRALQVVGDVVAEYLKLGEGRKFICSAVDTAHVEELQRQFLAAGINAATYTYKDRDEDRTETVTEFRRADSGIRGLITVTAASKGFDVPDIGCVIMARPLRKSLAEHIQFFGRGLRISPGKADCIVLDHSGNCARFWQPLNEFFATGCNELDDGKRVEKKKPKASPEADPIKCDACGHLHKPMPFCPSCGHEYPKRVTVEHVAGSLKEVLGGGNQAQLRKQIWPQIVSYVLESTDDMERAQRKAQAIYHEMTGEFAHARVETTAPAVCTRELRNKIKANQIRWAKGRAKDASHGTGASA